MFYIQKHKKIQGQIQSLERGVHFVEKVEDQKKKKRRRRSRVGERSSNITIKLKYIIIIPVYSFTDKQHCLINIVTALLELLIDCSITIIYDQSLGHVPLVPPSGSAPEILGHTLESSSYHTKDFICGIQYH